MLGNKKNYQKPEKSKNKYVTLIQYARGWENLNQLQQKACMDILEGNNIFLSGPAGTGKSFVLNFLFEFFDNQSISYGKTATTGIAALNIGGSTIHSWAGMGLADTSVGNILKGVFRNKKALSRIRSAKYLFIDECSMISADFFGKLSAVLKIVTKVKQPFGGIKICLSGDFLQLPPVIKDELNEEFDGRTYLFETDDWINGKFKTIYLKEIVRQKDDKEFAELLNEIRLGNITNIHKIKNRIGAKIKTPEGIKPVRILGYNAAVKSYNEKVLASLPGEEVTFTSLDSGENRHLETLDRNCPASKVITLKKDAQVMLLYNIDLESGLVNGSVGIVTGFDKSLKLPIVKFSNGVTRIIDNQEWKIKEQVAEKVAGKDIIRYKTVAKRTQIPLSLCYSASYHKTQGITLEYAIIDLQQVFTDSQAYVGLSRVKNLEGLSIVSDFNENKITVSQKCVDFYNSI